MNGLKKRLIERSAASREGRRYAAFYRGAKDWKAGKGVSKNPYRPGSRDHLCWLAGYEYAGPDFAEKES